jgi:hypothetical protein
LIFWFDHCPRAYPTSWPDWLVQGTSRPSGRISFCTRKDVYSKDDPLLPFRLARPAKLHTAIIVNP